jgi:hypothetical protein
MPEQMQPITISEKTSMNVDFTLSKISQADKTAMKELAYSNPGGNEKMTEDNIEHWYFDNPSQSYSLWKVEINGVIEGCATTNNFWYYIDGKECLVAMPQNVLTSINIRGKGFFNKLYYKTEEENIEENKVDYFLTFTNQASTPIFLNKFGYLNGKCPLLLITFSNPLDLFSKKKYKRVEDFSLIKDRALFHFDNAMQKSAAYFQWRYRQYTPENLHVIAVIEDQQTIGYAFLKVEKKKGVQFLILADILCEKEEQLRLIVEACRVYTTRNFFLFMLMFDLPARLNKRLLKVSVKDRFNFLVKGKTPEETKMLSEKDFVFFLGDMDIV